jgi:hypothetical protein
LEESRARIASFAHIRSTIHGVLFVFRAADGRVLDYRLEQVMAWNQGLVPDERARSLMNDISAVLPSLR